MPEKLAPTERLAAISAALARGEPSPELSVREFLWWWKVHRRGFWSVRDIRMALIAARLETVPDFEAAFLPSTIVFARAGQLPPVAPQQGPEPTLGPRTSPTPNPLNEAVVAPQSDPTYRIGKLAAANNVPISVAPTASVASVVTLMISRDFSQIPVMTGPRDVRGIVTWRSIGSRLAMGQPLSQVNDMLEAHVEVPFDTSLFSALPKLIETECVLVRGADRRISGIVTTTDVAAQFHSLSEPFLLLGEIENHIRRLLSNSLSIEVIVAARNESDTTRVVESVADLTFGEYVRLLENPTHWTQTGLPLDRSVVVSLLERVRRIRNDVMHFDPDGVPESDLATLRHAAHFFRQLQDLGVA